MRLSENKMSHECEILNGKVLAIKDKFKSFDQEKKKRRMAEYGEKIVEKRKKW
jgi:hypothetical protein